MSICVRRQLHPPLATNGSVPFNKNSNSLCPARRSKASREAHTVSLSATRLQALALSKPAQPCYFSCPVASPARAYRGSTLCIAGPSESWQHAVHPPTRAYRGSTLCIAGPSVSRQHAVHHRPERIEAARCAPPARAHRSSTLCTAEGTLTGMPPADDAEPVSLPTTARARTGLSPLDHAPPRARRRRRRRPWKGETRPRRHCHRRRRCHCHEAEPVPLPTATRASLGLPSRECGARR